MHWSDNIKKTLENKDKTHLFIHFKFNFILLVGDETILYKNRFNLSNIKDCLLNDFTIAIFKKKGTVLHSDVAFT